MTPRARILLAAVAIGVIGLLVMGWDRAQMLTGLGLPERTGPPMLIVAHRGHTGAYPEDTAEAIWDAARLGADGIEFDVHQSADGTWWVIHDSTVDRTTDGTGLVHDLTDAQLEGLTVDGGRGYDPERHRDIGLSRLTTVLDGLAGYSGTIYLDLQHATTADPVDLVAVSRGHDRAVICRSEADARAVKRADASVTTLLRVDRIQSAESLDATFLEAANEATASRVAEQPRPVVVYVDERYGFLGQEPMLRRAWAVGVQAFLAPELLPALEERDRMVAASVRASR